MSKKDKVSFKTAEVMDNVKKISDSLKEIRTALSNMPDCGIKKSYLISLVNFEAKVNSIVKKEQIDKAIKAIRQNPDILNGLSDDVKASFASNPADVAETVITETDADNDNAGVTNARKGRKH